MRKLTNVEVDSTVARNEAIFEGDFVNLVAGGIGVVEFDGVDWVGSGEEGDGLVEGQVHEVVVGPPPVHVQFAQLKLDSK